MSKKQYDDTELEYYGLTEEDLEKIKNEWDFIDGEDFHKAMKIVEVAYYLWVDVDIDNALDLIEKSKKNVLQDNLQEII